MHASGLYLTSHARVPRNEVQYSPPLTSHKSPLTTLPRYATHREVQVGIGAVRPAVRVQHHLLEKIAYKGDDIFSPSLLHGSRKTTKTQNAERRLNERHEKKKKAGKNAKK